MKGLRAVVVGAFVLAGLASVHCHRPLPQGGSGDGTPVAIPGSGSGDETGSHDTRACRSLDREACQETPACEAIPYWGESLVACDVDDRGFASNCPFEGCRPAGADCPTLEELTKRCPKLCGYNDFGIDPTTGCRSCDCRHD